jgi:ADP-heptose:LPS heptosyltransferase
VLSSAQLLISNDTSAAHIAAAVKTPFICISNGNHILRFHPYPREIFDKAFYIYPEEISSHIGNPEYLEKFRFASDLDINSISVEKVKEAVKKVL